MVEGETCIYYVVVWVNELSSSFDLTAGNIFVYRCAFIDRPFRSATEGLVYFRGDLACLFVLWIKFLIELYVQIKYLFAETLSNC